MSREWKNRIAGALIGVLALAGIGLTAVAQAEISDERARQIALERVVGTFLSLEREIDHGTRVVEVDIRDRAGRVVEVDVDARTGRILSVTPD
jgi:uncharacterized membrane protein YkoI